MKRSRFPAAVTAFALVFCYLPLVALVVNSFNASRFGSTWQGFSLRWYERLFGTTGSDLWEALTLSLTIAAIAALASMVLGTFAALALHRYRSPLQKAHLSLIYLPTVLPDILMGISLLLVFAAASVPLGKTTIILAHITFCISYVALVVLGRLADFDESLIDAARDLGATATAAFLRVRMPLLAPGIIAGGLLAFTLSIDDFVITYFTTGPGTTTLPLKIWSMAKHSKEMPVINALSTFLLVFTFLAVAIALRLTRKRG